MPRDFLLEDIQSQNTKNIPRDFLNEDQIQPQESFSKSIALAPFRMGTDIYNAGYNLLQKIPDYYQTAKKEIPEFINPLKLPSLHAFGQGLAGINEGINTLAQLPLDVAKYGANRLNILPQSVPNIISKITPEDNTQTINKLFGQPKGPGEELERGIFRNIPTFYGMGELTSLIKPSGFLKTKNSIAKSILDQHDLLENRASKGFETVSNEVNNRGITQVPISPNSIEKLQEYFPKTRTVNSLLDRAKIGDYNSLRKIQSDLYTKAKDNLKSPLESERLRGSEMLEKRDDINQSISNHLKDTGNYDLDNILNNARKDYSTLQRIYYNPKINKSIINMVDTASRKIPKNLTNILQEQSKPMQKLRDFHPGLEENLKKYQITKNALSPLKKYGLPAALGAFGSYEYMKNK